jgi:hypothetical protein
MWRSTLGNTVLERRFIVAKFQQILSHDNGCLHITQHNMWRCCNCLSCDDNKTRSAADKYL